MVEDGTLHGLAYLLEYQSQQDTPDFPLVAVLLACLMNFMHRANFRRVVVELRLVAACNNLINRWSVSIEERSGREDRDSAIGRAFLRLSCQLSWQHDMHPQMLVEGIVDVIVGAMMSCVDPDLDTASELTTAISNLTATADGSIKLVTPKVMSLLWEVLDMRGRHLASKKKPAAKKVIPFRATMTGSSSKLVMTDKDYWVSEVDIAIIIHNIASVATAARQLACFRKSCHS